MAEIVAPRRDAHHYTMLEPFVEIGARTKSNFDFHCQLSVQVLFSHVVVFLSWCRQCFIVLVAMVGDGEIVSVAVRAGFRWVD